MRRRTRWWLVAMFVLVLLMVLSCFVPVPPFGRFKLVGLSGADGYFAFRNGESFYQNFPWEELKLTNQSTEKRVGTYRKENGKWVAYDLEGKRVCHIETTLFTLRLNYSFGGSDQYPRWEWQKEWIRRWESFTSWF